MSFDNKLIIFDLDGVLIDSREIHYESLNAALKGYGYEITREEHLSKYDGLSTTKKLQILSKDKGLPCELYSEIWQRKQKATIELYQKYLSPNKELRELILHMIAEGYKISVASNSIRKTLAIALQQLGILDLIDFFIGNDEVSHAKPYPEMYWHCMSFCKALPKNTIIVEDSHIGREAALSSGANLFPVSSPQDLINKDLLYFASSHANGSISLPWRDTKLNVLIPMAGAGSRFQTAGYTFPKPLIEVRGKPMIQVVCESLNIEANYIFITQKDHYEEYNLQYLLGILKPNCKIVLVDRLTEGAACTTLLAKEHINNSNPLLIANSDQFIEWDSNNVMYSFAADGIDGGILTFKATHPKWSYAKIGDDGFVSEVAEKKVISDNATVGVYYWQKGSDYVKYAEQMIAKNVRVNNEFYVCPIFNEAIADGKKLRVKEISKMWGIGTPEDLNYFLQNYHKEI